MSDTQNKKIDQDASQIRGLAQEIKNRAKEIKDLNKILRQAERKIELDRGALDLVAGYFSFDFEGKYTKTKAIDLLKIIKSQVSFSKEPNKAPEFSPVFRKACGSLAETVNYSISSYTAESITGLFMATQESISQRQESFDQLEQKVKEYEVLQEQMRTKYEADAAQKDSEIKLLSGEISGLLVRLTAAQEGTYSGSDESRPLASYVSHLEEMLKQKDKEIDDLTPKCPEGEPHMNKANVEALKLFDDTYLRYRGSSDCHQDAHNWAYKTLKALHDKNQSAYNGKQGDSLTPMQVVEIIETLGPYGGIGLDFLGEAVIKAVDSHKEELGLFGRNIGFKRLKRMLEKKVPDAQDKRRLTIDMAVRYVVAE